MIYSSAHLTSTLAILATGIGSVSPRNTISKGEAQKNHEMRFMLKVVFGGLIVQNPPFPQATARISLPLLHKINALNATFKLLCRNDLIGYSMVGMSVYRFEYCINACTNCD